MADRVVYVEKKKGCFSGCLGTIAGLFLICIILMAFASILTRKPDGQGTAVSPTASPAPARTAPSRPVLHVGDRVVINLPNADYGPWLATSEDAWNEMLDAENAKSMELMNRLTEQGRVIRVQNGTPGVIVKTAFMSTLVRLTDGPFEGQEGWLQREFMAPAGSP